MPRKSRYRTSKTGIRHHLQTLAQYGVDEIDQFREHVHDGFVERQRTLERRAESLPQEAQEFLADEMVELDMISCLADQLSIIALYRVVEMNTGRMLAHEFGKTAARKAYSKPKLEKLLKDQKGLELSRVPHYRAIEQLRLLNNAIKHADRRWNEGEQLDVLNKAYPRLRAKVPAYIFRLAERMQLRYK